MTLMSERRYAGEHVISEAERGRSRDTLIIAASQTLLAGAVLGQVLTGALSAAAAANAGNTGNGVMGAITVDAGAAEGEYRLIFIEPAANLGDFVVERPDGVIDGHGKVGTAYDGKVNFTLADGAADFVAGDGFVITVTAADAAAQDQFKAHNPAATDGTQIAAAVLFDAVTTGVGQTAKAVAHVRDCQVNADLLAWNGHNTNQKAAAVAQLRALGVIVR
ncbi:head decoration protein [Caulobacter sp. B11]|uniref:head decoration protein n=1 Tax=Caulobacter sp. B11 TaxID=2048899 RepID=UPI000C12BB95|nr:head decoration protein [Caulobacter sp. B11]PHY12830.1 head decoration protein [Caulobacter sp. B11]